MSKRRASFYVALVSLGLTVFAMPPRPASACFAYIGWYAEMGASGAQSATKASGKARMLYDQKNPFGSIIVETHNLPGVTRIELRAVRHANDTTGPVFAVLYDVHRDGPYHGVYTKLLRPADIIPQSNPHIVTVPDVGTALFHEGAAVAVCTRADPAGEIAGIIKPHRVLVYSDQGSFHDPKLHQATMHAGRA